MKRFILFLVVSGLLSCSSPHIPDGEYAVFSYRQTQLAIKEGKLIDRVPVFVFSEGKVSLRGDFGSVHFLSDSLYDYDLQGDRIVLKGNDDEVKEYRCRVSQGDRVYIDLELFEDYVQELTLASIR